MTSVQSNQKQELHTGSLHVNKCVNLHRVRGWEGGGRAYGVGVYNNILVMDD